MISRFALLVGVGCGLVAQEAMADCLGSEPVSAAKAFYQQHGDFYYVDPAKVKDVVTPRLFQVLATNYACSVDQECALDSDPWVDAQDGDIAEPITFDLGDHATGQATVVMHYIFTLSASDQTPQQVALKLQQSGQCWQVDDMITPRGKSLVDEITQWFKVNGDNPPSPDDSP